MERQIMKYKEAAKSIFVMLLALMMTLSMTGYTFVEAFAEDGEEPAAAEVSLNKESSEETGSAETAAPEEEVKAEAEVPAEAEFPESAKQDEAEPEYTEELSEEPAVKPAEETAEETQGILEEAPEETLQDPAMEAAKLGEITVRASRDESFISAFWTKADGAAYYMVYLNEDTTGVKVAATENKYIFALSPEAPAVQTVKVEAYRLKESTVDPGADSANPVAAEPEYEKFAEGRAVELSAITRPKLSNANTLATYLGLSLRDMIGESNDGYAVTQGAATDGKYAYFMMASSTTQKGRILKVNLANFSDYTYSEVLDIHHANGMTYDSKRNKLVAVGYGEWRQQLSFIDPVTFEVTHENISYPYEITGVNEEGKKNGVAAIAYVEKYNVYVARSRGRNDGVGDSYLNNDIWVINADNLKVIGHVYVHITGKYPETYQAMDADEKYVYYLLSPGDGQKNNIILCLDWDSENLLPVLNGEKEYVEYTWRANNNDSGDPDAVLTIPIAHESEGIFHTTDANGNAHFYVSEYYGRNHYKTTTKKVKVKWKKVRKWYNKKTKKWTTKKPKKKYRGKSKKVWKYKTKKKKVTVKDYWARDDYVYYIGSF